MGNEWVKGPAVTMGVNRHAKRPITNDLHVLQGLQSFLLFSQPQKLYHILPVQPGSDMDQVPNTSNHGYHYNRSY